MTMFDIQMQIVNDVKGDAAFNAKVVSLLGSEMMYSIDENEILSQDTYPIFMMHKNMNANDVEDGKQMILQFIMAALLGDKHETIDGILYYPSVRDIEILSIDAMEIIKGTICDMGYTIAQINNLFPPIGEADDVQSVMSFRLEQENFI